MLDVGGHIQDLGDAEVEQFRFSVGGDQDIARLQVAMHDQIPVQIGGGRADLEEQCDLLPHAQTRGKNVDGFAIDVFHGQKRLAARQMAGIQHASDVRVSQRCEYLPFLEEPLALRVARARRKQFHGQALGDFAVGAFGQINHAHAAASDHVQQPVGAGAPPLTFEQRKGAAGGHGHVALKKGSGAGIEFQERLDFVARLLVHRVVPKISGARGGRQVH